MKNKNLAAALIVACILFIFLSRANTEPTSSTITLYEETGITISLKNAKTSDIELHIDNQSANNIEVSCESVIINGFSFPALLMQKVHAWDEANARLSVDASALSVAKIDTVADLKLHIYISDEKKEKIYSGVIGTVIDSAYSQTVDSSGIVVYDSGEYYITARAYDLDNPSRAVLLYVENKTDNPLSLLCDSLSVNGQMLNGTFSLQKVEAHTHAQFVLDARVLTFLSDNNEEILNVSHVDEMSIQLQLAPWYGTGFSTADMFTSEVVKIIG